MWVYRSSHCLPGLAAACSAARCSAGVQCAPWSGILTPWKCCAPASGIVCSTTSPSGATLKPSRAASGGDALTCSRRASLASRLVSRESAPHLPISATAGRIPLGSFQKCARDGYSWRTSQASLLPSPALTSRDFSATWPRSGMMRGGVSWELPTLELHTKETDGGVYLPTPSASRYGRNKSPSPGAAERLSLDAMAARGLWPTPTVSGNHNRKGASKTSGDGLATAVLKRGLWATPTAHDAKDTGTAPSEGRRNSPCLAYQAGGKLNPEWVEWLMGWPIGQSGLKQLETVKFQAWRRSHGSFLAGQLGKLIW